MSAGRFLTATVVGGVVLFVMGYVIWGLAFMGFFESHMGSASGVMKEPMNFPMLILGQLALAALLTLMVGSWARVSGFGPAFRVGAVAGLLMSLGYDLTQYATTNLMDLTATLVDPILGIVWMGLGAGAIGVLLARGQTHASA